MARPENLPEKPCRCCCRLCENLRCSWGNYRCSVRQYQYLCRWMRTCRTRGLTDEELGLCDRSRVEIKACPAFHPRMGKPQFLVAPSPESVRCKHQWYRVGLNGAKWVKWCAKCGCVHLDPGSEADHTCLWKIGGVSCVYVPTKAKSVIRNAKVGASKESDHA